MTSGERRIYLDNAATTPVDDQVVQAMIPYFSTYYGNAASLHSFGEEAWDGMEKSREFIADLIGAHPEEIIFTAGGTESDNMAVKGVAHSMKKKTLLKGPHIITSTIEHPGVLETCRYVEKNGFHVQYLPVNHQGMIDLGDLEDSITTGTFLISIMHANNEIGTIEPIAEIGELAHENGILFHTDAVQSVGKEPIDVKAMNIDMLSLSSHKIYGPKGIGALYLRKGMHLEPVIHGGGHQKGLRSGTENVPGIVGLGKACELAKKRMTGDVRHMKKLRDILIKEILGIEKTQLTGHPTLRLANNTHFRFIGIEGEALLMRLNDQGIAASTGSACSSKKLSASHVLRALGLKGINLHGSLRLTVGRQNTMEEIRYVLDVIPGIIDDLREISPVWHRRLNTN